MGRLRNGHSRWLSRDNRAQSGLFDAVLFFLVLFTALSTMQFASQSNVQDVVDRQYLSQFTIDTRATLLSCTINSSSYTTEGALIVLEDKTVEELLVEDLYLRTYGQVDEQSLVNGIEAPIRAILINLTGPEYHFRLIATFPAAGTQSGSSASAQIVISDLDTIADERWAATGVVMMPDQHGAAEITLMLWQ